VPASAVDAYRAADGWKDFGAITTHQAEIEALKAQVQALQADTAQLKNTIAARDKSITAYRADSIQMKSIIAELSSSNSSYQADIADLQAKLSDCEGSNGTSMRAVEASLPDIYPNPAKEVVTVNNASGKAVSIFNNSGIKVFEKEVQSDEEQISVASWQKGIYFVRISDNGKVVGTVKLIKN
jgi:chromosome segregation ATPase